MIYQMRQVITMKFEIPSKVETIIHTLEAAGFEAYAVGGCVRDALLGGRPMTGISPPQPHRSRSRPYFTEQWTPESPTAL